MSPPKPQTGILWIASYPKSGNTWTRTFLHNLFHIVEGKAQETDINSMNEYTTWEISAKRYAEALGVPATSVDRSEIARVRPQIQADIAASTNGVAIVKTHHALVMDRGVSTINFKVTSGAIYVVRNPLDVAISFAAHMATDIDTAIEHMATDDLETGVSEKSVYEVYGSWSQHVASWTRKPHRAMYVMRYEDMLESTTETFAALARHLLLRPTPTQLQTAIDNSSFEKLRQQEDAAGFREKPEKAEKFFREGRSEQWRTQLSRRQVRRIVSAHSAQMRRFGYLTEELAKLA